MRTAMIKLEFIPKEMASAMLFSLQPGSAFLAILGMPRLYNWNKNKRKKCCSLSFPLYHKTLISNTTRKIKIARNVMPTAFFLKNVTFPTTFALCLPSGWRWGCVCSLRSRCQLVGRSSSCPLRPRRAWRECLPAVVVRSHWGTYEVRWALSATDTAASGSCPPAALSTVGRHNLSVSHNMCTKWRLYCLRGKVNKSFYRSTSKCIQESF